MRPFNSNGNLLGVYTHTHIHTQAHTQAHSHCLFIENYNSNLICNRCEQHPNPNSVDCATIKQLPHSQSQPQLQFWSQFQFGLNSDTLFLLFAVVVACWKEIEIVLGNCYKLPANSSWIAFLGWHILCAPVSVAICVVAAASTLLATSRQQHRATAQWFKNMAEVIHLLVIPIKFRGSYWTW